MYLEFNFNAHDFFYEKGFWLKTVYTVLLFASKKCALEFLIIDVNCLLFFVVFAFGCSQLTLAQPSCFSLKWICPLYLYLRKLNPPTLLT